jgi:hypothetical protein
VASSFLLVSEADKLDSMTNWGKIHLLESRLHWHRDKAGYRHDELVKWQNSGRMAHHRNDQRGILQARKEIIKWKGLLDPEVREVYALERAINALRPKTQVYHAGGWVAPGEPFRMQRQDMGQDFEIPLYHHVIAPGRGKCIGYASDGPFPNGFGSPYALVEIWDGRFGGQHWYLGHANEPIIRPGETFGLHQPLARLNHGLNAGWGWIELGHLPYGGMNEGERWHHLFTDVSM